MPDTPADRRRRQILDQIATLGYCLPGIVVDRTSRCGNLPAREAKDVKRYEVVIIGGALYAVRRHRHARRFAKRHTRQVRSRPTWFFSSGPLDESATQKDLLLVKGVQSLVERVHAKGRVTFGGRLAPDAKGFPASVMAKKHLGDYANPDQVRTWTNHVAA